MHKSKIDRLHFAGNLPQENVTAIYNNYKSKFSDQMRVLASDESIRKVNELFFL